MKSNKLKHIYHKFEIISNQLKLNILSTQLDPFTDQTSVHNRPYLLDILDFHHEGD